MAEEYYHNRHDLAFLLTIYPIREAVATHLLSGDLIRLSRLCTPLRSILHDFPADAIDIHSRHIIHPGQQSTPSWQHLLALTTYDCSAPTHKPLKSESATKNPVHPCKHCSLPTCEACIIRTSLAKGSSEILAPIRTRTRYMCPLCWTQGRLRRDFRYPVNGTVNRERVWEGRGYGMRGGWCCCTVKKDQWVCGECRDFQGRTFFYNEVPTRFGVERTAKGKPSMGQTEETSGKVLRCYGSGCTNVISEPDRDRRRICLWCSKPLARQLAGEERMKWDAKIRTINAASRSADIEEWARNRFQTLTMSRRQMRGTSNCIAFDAEAQDHDLPLFVRHFDAINYRAFIVDHTPGAIPDPDTVWRSKNGKWVYQRRFLKLIGQAVVSHCAVKGDQPWGRIDPTYLRRATCAGKMSSTEAISENTRLPSRRTNAELRREIRAARRVYENSQIDQHALEDLVQRRVALSHLMADDPGACFSKTTQEIMTDDRHSSLPIEVQSAIIQGTFLASQVRHETPSAKAPKAERLQGMIEQWDQSAANAVSPDSEETSEDEAASSAASPNTNALSYAPEQRPPADLLSQLGERAGMIEEEAEQADSSSGTAEEEGDAEQGDPPPYTP